MKNKRFLVRDEGGYFYTDYNPGDGLRYRELPESYRKDARKIIYRGIARNLFNATVFVGSAVCLGFVASWVTVSIYTWLN